MIDTSPLHLPADPIEGFSRWFAEAQTANVHEPTAMTLATASSNGRPSARIVLFKGLSTLSGRRVFQFFTNYESTKSKELLENPRAALVFYWGPMGRQLRIEGTVTKATPEESETYFQSRARGSRLGAWASPQSQKIGSREELEKKVKAIEERFKSGELVCPPHWGGWNVLPERIEFWQSGQDRLHDRFSFTWTGRGWECSRLAP